MMDKRSTASVRSKRVQQLLGDLGVVSCTQTKLKALSGGERKRVALAVQVGFKSLVTSFNSRQSAGDVGNGLSIAKSTWLTKIRARRATVLVAARLP